MVKPKLKDRLKIQKAKAQLAAVSVKLEEKNRSNGKKSIDEEGETIVVATSELLAEKDKQEEEKEIESVVDKKAQKKLEKLAKKQSKKEKKQKLREVKSKSEENEDEEVDDGAPKIVVASLEEELQKDFAAVVAVDHEESEKEDDDEESNELDFGKLAKSDDEDEDDEDSEDDDDDDDGDDDDDDDDEDDEDDVPYSDVEFDSDADIVPHSKVTVNKVAALKDSYNRIKLPWENHPFSEHQSITSENTAEGNIRDIFDDTERELYFYKQGLEATKLAREKLLALKIPFSRPSDYFAEMIKSDEHMDKLKQKLVHEATAQKKSDDAKKQRLLKKFGKKVQMATLQERQKQKRETLDKIKEFRKKRKDGGKAMDNDEFDIAIEESAGAKDEWNRRNGNNNNKKRKFNDREGGSFGGNKGGNFGGNKTGGNKKAKRPGKSKRNSKRN